MSSVTNEIIHITDVGSNVSDVKESKISSYTWNSFNRPWFNAITSCNFQEILKMLSEDKSLAFWKNPFDGWTALHYFAKNGNLRGLDLLVKNYSIDVNSTCQNGATPLHIAVSFSQHLFIRRLIEEYHARTDIMDYAGRFPLNLMSRELSSDFENLLLSGRLSLIRKDLSILTQNESTRKRIDAVPSMNDTLKVRNFSTTISCPNRIPIYSEADVLLSFLSGDSKNIEDVVRCLRHGKVISIDTDPFKYPPSHNSIKSVNRMSKSMTLDTHKLKHAASLKSLGRNSAAFLSGFANTLPFGRAPSTDAIGNRRATLILPPIAKTQSTREKDVTGMVTFSSPKKPSVFKRKNQKMSAFARYSFSGSSSVN